MLTEIAGLPPMKLYAEQDNIFYLENFYSEYRFISNEDGRIIKLIIHEHGEDYELIKTRWAKDTNLQQRVLCQLGVTSISVHIN